MKTYFVRAYVFYQAITLATWIVSGSWAAAAFVLAIVLACRIALIELDSAIEDREAAFLTALRLAEITHNTRVRLEMLDVMSKWRTE